MSLFGMMRTGVSGMNAQANKLSTISDNVSNSDTTGYKEATTQFSSLINNTSTSEYTSGAVATDVRYNITGQGNIVSGSDNTDLAISGNGFFVVNDTNGTPYLTRAGSFVPDASGNLVNAAGFYLMGYSLAAGGSTGVANGLTGLTKINVNQTALQATATTSGTLTVNLPAGATAVTTAADLPSANPAASAVSYTDKTSLVTYDSEGNAVTLDVYMTNTGGNNWDVAVYNQADATAGGFPYTSGGVNDTPMNTSGTTLSFDSSGNLTGGSPLTVTYPSGQSVSLDLSKTTQLGTSYTVVTATANGNAPSALKDIEIGTDGTVYNVYQDGAQVASYKIPLATVPSPDNLTPEAGNVYLPSINSGDVVVGTAGAAGLGSIKSSSLEQSTVDIASELTNMIEAQRAYTANSKVFQTGADLMSVVVNLQTQ